MTYTLKDRFAHYGCDRSTRKHQYHTIYDPLFRPMRKDKLRILELGVFRGAGLQAFEDYFPEAELFGVDLFERVKMLEVLGAIDADRTTLIKGSTWDEETVTKVRSGRGNLKFDIIIDDAAHYPEANRLTFENFFPLLKKSGVYIVEDWWPLAHMNQQELRNKWLTDRPEKYNMPEYEKAMAVFNQHSVIHHDLRKTSGHPDSYLLEIRHAD